MEHYVPSLFLCSENHSPSEWFSEHKKAAPAGGAVRKNLCGYAGGFS